MKEVFPNLFVGDDNDFEKTRREKGWSWLRPIKFGPGGHKDLLKYTGKSAPEGENYLSIRKGNLLALNLLDVDDPNFIPKEAIDKGIEFIGERLAAGDKVLSACNRGHTRGPSMALLYLRTIGEYPEPLYQAVKKFRQFYPKYDPGMGWKQFIKDNWDAYKKVDNG